MSQFRSVISGVGSRLPERVLTNAELSTMVDTSDQWIRERTGISERRIAAAGETTADLALKAAEAALADAGMQGSEIDLIVLATTTPDFTFPATATQVQARLGAQGAAFDLQAVCSGFIYALATADNFLARGQARNALVIGAETISRLIDWQDRGTCILFGDGAGAVVLRAVPADETTSGILQTYIRSDGQFAPLLQTDGGVSSTGTVGKLRMQGNQVFRHAVNKIAEAIETVIERAGVTAEDIDWFVPHQANKRILDSVADKLGIPHERVVVTVAEHGNTSAASVPLALDVAIRDGRIKSGDLVLMEALGGGFTWGAALVRM
jgi:3-oxoacyl-[acyl-carrier-protein] synthase-3